MTCYCRYRLGNAFHELRLDYHAAACYRRCLALNQNDLRFWNDLGSACGIFLFHFEAHACYSSQIAASGSVVTVLQLHRVTLMARERCRLPQGAHPPPQTKSPLTNPSPSHTLLRRCSCVCHTPHRHSCSRRTAAAVFHCKMSFKCSAKRASGRRVDPVITTTFHFYHTNSSISTTLLAGLSLAHQAAGGGMG